MSKRPNIRSEQEKQVEHAIQRQRRERQRAMKDAAVKGRIAVEPPAELSFSRGPVDHEMPSAVEGWIAAEAALQEQNYRRIVREVERLAPQRDSWVKEFFRRITGSRGYSVHAGTRRTLETSEIPTRPRRPWRVVW